MGRLLKIFLICLFLLASNHTYQSSKVFYLYVDSRFNKEEITAINHAARLWERSTDYMIEFRFAETKNKFDPFNFFSHKMEPTIWRAEEDPELFFFESVVIGGPILGFAPPKESVILVPDRIETEEQFEMVVAHELGHHIGLGHTQSIMNPSAKIPCITKYDLAQFCSLYGCDTEDTKPHCLDY